MSMSTDIPGNDDDVCGESVRDAKDKIRSALMDADAACICVEGEAYTGKTKVVGSCLRDIGCDVFRWDDCGGCGGAHALHAVSTKKSLLSLVASTSIEDCHPPTTVTRRQESRLRPVVILADNVHDMFVENRTTIQNIARRAKTIATKDRVAERGKPRTGRRPVHLVVTYDPTKLEARILAQLRDIPTPNHLIRLFHPDATETCEYVERVIRAELELGCVIIRSSSSIFERLSPLVLRDASRGVMAALTTARRYVMDANATGTICCDDDIHGKGEGRGEERAGDNGSSSWSRLHDDNVWDSKFCYTGYKCDSLVNCLHSDTSLRLDDVGEARRATRAAHALFLANVMVGGMKTEFDGQGLKIVASALCETASNVLYKI